MRILVRFLSFQLAVASAGCSQARRVYVDLGANWANTLRFYDDLVVPSDVLPSEDRRWHVFGFEASPLIAPFVEQYTAFLNGERAEAPRSCLPPTGSSHHLMEYAAAYGCPTHDFFLMRQCMFDRLRGPLGRLEPDPALNSSGLVASRLNEAQRCSPSEQEGARFVFVPAAVGAADGWLEMYNAPEQLIRGGSVALWEQADLAGLDAQNFITEPRSSSLFNVRVVDVASWLVESFTEDDFVVLKMDIEGAEYAIIDSLLASNKLKLVDVLAIELHDRGFVHVWHRSQEELFRRMQEQAPSMRIVSQYNGYDSHSAITAANVSEIRAEARACGIPGIPPG